MLVILIEFKSINAMTDQLYSDYIKKITLEWQKDSLVYYNKCDSKK